MKVCRVSCTWRRFVRKNAIVKLMLFIVALCVVGYPCIFQKRIPRIVEGQLGKTCFHDTCIINIEHSGKFIITDQNQSGEGTTVEFDTIQELDEDNKELGKNGPQSGKHSFNNLAELHFNFTTLVNRTYWGIPQICFNMSATIPGPNAKLNVQACFFKEKGTIPLCNGFQELSSGMIGFNIEISKWPFYGNGEDYRDDQKGEIGEYLHFSLKIKSAVQAKKGNKETDGQNYEAQKFLFRNDIFSFPSLVFSDNNCYAMPDTYPLIEDVSDGYKMTFWFPKFKNLLIYKTTAQVNVNAASLEESLVIVPYTRNVLTRLFNCLSFNWFSFFY